MKISRAYMAKRTWETRNYYLPWAAGLFVWICEVGGSLGNQNRFDFLQRNRPHSLSGWHVTFYNESKVWFNLKGKGWTKKNQNKTPNLTASWLGNHTFRAQHQSRRRKQHFPQKISAPRYLGWSTLYVILMAQSGSENFKCVCYGREESRDPQQRQLGSRLVQWEKET